MNSKISNILGKNHLKGKNQKGKNHLKLLYLEIIAVNIFVIVY